MKIEHRYRDKAPIELDRVQRIRIVSGLVEFEIVEEEDGTLSLRNNIPLGNVLVVRPHASNMIIISTADPRKL